MFISGLIIGVLLTLVVLWAILPAKLFRVDESKYNFDETTERLVKATDESNWSMPHQYDLQATMDKHGIKVMPVKVFSMCQPQYAGKILSGDDERLVSAMMPCRVAVYQRNDGKTYISRLNAGLFSNFMGKKVKNIMGSVAVENEEILSSIIKN